MKALKEIGAALGISIVLSASVSAASEPPRKVLVVMSGADHLSLQDGLNYKRAIF
jgi:hypothetical protein